MLEVMDLSKKYGKVRAADHVSFTVPDGRVGILLGPNGAGKSTVIKSIAGLLRFEGQVRIQGIPSREKAARKIFAYVPEMPSMYDMLTVREHMEFIRRAYGAETTDQEVEELLARFELLDKQEKLGNELSKGMMQKVSICCALVIHPQVILLDEPMVGLDPAAIKELKQMVLELRDRGATVLISTHMLEMVKELWDITFVMNQGHILGSYNREQVGDEDLEELFFAVTGQEKKDQTAVGQEKEDLTVTGQEKKDPAAAGQEQNGSAAAEREQKDLAATGQEKQDSEKGSSNAGEGGQ